MDGSHTHAMPPEPLFTKQMDISRPLVRSCKVSKPGLAGFFHLVEETGLNPGLNRPGRNRFLPPEVEETGQNWKKAWNAWLSEYFPLQEAVILNTYETTAKNVLDTNTLLLFTCSFHGKWNKKLWWLPGRNKSFPLEVEETVIKKFKSLKWINM